MTLQASFNAAIEVYGGAEKLDHDIALWEAEERKYKEGSLAWNLAHATLDYLRTLRTVGKWNEKPHNQSV